MCKGCRINSSEWTHRQSQHTEELRPVRRWGHCLHSVSAADSCTWAPCEGQRCCRCGKRLVSLLRPCRHHLFCLWFVSVCWKGAYWDNHTHCGTGSGRSGQWGDPQSNTLKCWAGWQLCLVPIDVVWQEAGVTAGCLSSGQYCGSDHSGSDAQGTAWLLHWAWWIFFPTFYVPCVLLAFFYLKCTGNMKSLASAKLEVGNVFNKCVSEALL